MKFLRAILIASLTLSCTLQATLWETIKQQFTGKPVVQQQAPITIGYIRIFTEISAESTPTPLDQLDWLIHHDQCYGYLIHINSLGGTGATTAEIIKNVLEKIKEKKPVVILVENYCCSAAYLIASAANKIVAPSTANVGSIGVIRTYEQYSNTKLNNELKANLNIILLRGGKYKQTGNPYTTMSAEERQYLQEITNQEYDDFCSIISKARNLDFAQRDQWANGKFFTATQAVPDLVDRIGGPYEAKEELVKLIQEYFNLTVTEDQLELIPLSYFQPIG